MTTPFFSLTLQEIRRSFAEVCRELLAETDRFLQATQGSEPIGFKNEAISKQAARQYAQYAAALAAPLQKAEATALKLSALLRQADAAMDAEALRSGEALFQLYGNLFREVHGLLQEHDRAFSAKAPTAPLRTLRQRTQAFAFRMRRMEADFSA